MIIDCCPECKLSYEGEYPLHQFAPQLLEALEMMVGYAESPDFDGAPSDYVLAKARDAIAAIKKSTKPIGA